MELQRIHHIGIAVRELSVVETQLQQVFDRTFEETGVTPTGMPYGLIQIGETKLEFLAPSRDGGVIGAYLERRGEGIHHIAVQVPDICRALLEMRDKGVRLVDEEPKAGVHDMQTAFVHPSALAKILLELVEA